MSKAKFVFESAKCIDVPSRFANHPLIRNRLFYVLPTPLLDEICMRIRAAEKHLQMEIEIARGLPDSTDTNSPNAPN